MTGALRIAYMSLLVAQSLALFLLEGLLPLPFLAPGAKLGLASIVTLVALYTLPRWQDVLLILLARTALASLFGGGLTVFLYSICGGVTSLFSMLLLKQSRRFSLLGVSAAGGFFHNLGQLLLAVLVMESAGLWLYLPILGTCGILTGCLTGTLAGWLLKKLPHRHA